MCGSHCQRCWFPLSKGMMGFWRFLKNPRGGSKVPTFWETVLQSLGLVFFYWTQLFNLKAIFRNGHHLLPFISHWFYFIYKPNELRSQSILPVFVQTWNREADLPHSARETPLIFPLLFYITPFLPSVVFYPLEILVIARWHSSVQISCTGCLFLLSVGTGSPGCQGLCSICRALSILSPLLLNPTLPQAPGKSVMTLSLGKTSLEFLPFTPLPHPLSKRHHKWYPLFWGFF